MKIEKILLLKLHLGIMAYHIVMNIWRLIGWIIFSFSDNDNGCHPEEFVTKVH